MANTIIGSIASIGPTQSLMAKNGNAFQKRDLVINVRRFDPNTGEPVTDWENTPKLSFMGDKCRDLDRFQVGQMVVISFDLQGRKYTNANNETDIITEARPYKIEAYGQRPSQPASQPMAASAPAQAPTYPQSAPMSQAQAQPQYPQQPQSFQDPFKP
jgi:hypothetical protein|nr:MAG TPA: SINGLE-STRANDED DNA BINDING PROTEIN REPLICATION, SINGLE-STRANDED DNA, SINGLE-STRANDED.3A [Caudoviricetes sp.]